MDRADIDQGKQYFYNTDKSKINKAAADWMAEVFVPYEALAVTLQVKRSEPGSRRAMEAGDKAVEHYAKRLNRLAYRQRAKKDKGGMEVSLIVFREGGDIAGPPLHYHAIIAVPEGYSLEVWKSICSATWAGLKHSGKYNDLQDYTSSGWDDYILKYRTKAERYDSIVTMQRNINDGKNVLH